MNAPQGGPGHKEDSHGHNLVVLHRFIALFGFSLILAATGPSENYAVVMHTLLYIAAVMTGLRAGFQRQKLAPEHLTDWDMASVLMALSILARFFVDTKASVLSTITML
jgi:hypothetical protein